MPCFILIFSTIFEKAKKNFRISPSNEEKEQLDRLLRDKLEEITNKPIRTHQELKAELIRLKNEDPKAFEFLEKWLYKQIQQLRKARTTRVTKIKKDKQKPKKKKQEITMYV